MASVTMVWKADSIVDGGDNIGAINWILDGREHFSGSVDVKEWSWCLGKCSFLIKN